MRVSFSTVVHGDEHWFAMFENFLAPSLMQPGNLPTLKAAGADVVYSIYSLESHMDRIQDLLTRTGLASVATIRLRLGKPTDQSASSFNRMMSASSLIDQIKFGYQDKRACVICPPDFVYGDGAIFNLLTIRREPGTCIASPYLRVDGELAREKLRQRGFPIANADLVSIALGTLHRDVLEARMELDRRNTYFTGMALQSITDRLHALEFRVPRVQVAEFTENDLRYFEFQQDFQHYEGSWPGKLIADRRFKMVGSSDIAFAVELAPAVKGGKIDRVPGDGDYVGSGLHNYITRNYLLNLHASEPVDLDAIARARGLPTA